MLASRRRLRIGAGLRIVMLNSVCISRSQLLLQYLTALGDSDDLLPVNEIPEPEVKES
jgi:hypothetical protein